MSTSTDLRYALQDGPLSTRVDRILGLARPSVELAPSAVRMSDLGTGDSRIGGTPDLPPGTAWPRWKGEPQSFCAQIDLSSLRGLPAVSALPSSGWLSFFYSARQDTWGFDPQDRGSWAVVYTPADAPLARAEVPDDLPDEARFHPCRLDPGHRVTLPPWESKQVEQLDLSEAEENHYFEILDSVVPAGGHRLLGHPDQVQGDMTVECALVTRGLYLGDSSGWSDPRAEKLKEGWSQWQLLFQVASDETPKMMWGDAGYLYYWIRTSDLVAADFDETWMILQCS